MSSVINAESRRRCYKCGRSPAEDSLTTLFRFPKPGNTNTLRCELWAKYCFPDKEYWSPEFQDKLHGEHKMLCNRHFPRTSFSDYPETSQKLHRFAVPDDMKELAEDLENDQDLKFKTGRKKGPGPLLKATAKLHRIQDSPSCKISTDVENTDICGAMIDDDDADDVSDTLVESNVCRVCLAMDVKMYDLNNIELREMFQNITGIAVTETNHSILERLCWECAGRLKAAAAFRNKALLSDALLQGLTNTGEHIRKNDITVIKDSEDYLKTAATLTVVEAFHIVDIDPENDGIPPLSVTNIVQNTVPKGFIELKKGSIMEEDNDQTDVEDESMIEAPINTEMEYDPFAHICPNTGEESSNVVLETNPLFSSNIPLKEDANNSANSSPPPSCSHVKPKYPILGYLHKTPGDCENKIKKHVIKITKRDSISKIVSKNSKEIVSAKSKNFNMKLGGIWKKSSDLKLLKNTQVKANSPTDETP